MAALQHSTRPSRPRNNNILPLRARLVRRRREIRVLIDRVSERLAFERAALRLYDTLLEKFDRHGSWHGGPRREELQDIRNQERAHYLLLTDVLEQLGADPTSLTPAARRAQRVASGIPELLHDPSTDLRQCLEAILIGELVENDGWESLSDLAMSIGQDKLAMLFERALEDERQHLLAARAWLGAALSHEACGQVAASFITRAAKRELAAVHLTPIIVPAAKLVS